MVFVRRLAWDDWNVEHIARHDISPQDVEEVCHGTPAEYETYGGRLLLVGPNARANLISVILAPLEDPGVYYTVTARSASKRERRQYRQGLIGEDA